MISHRYRCIFVHVPRTGGTSIEQVIWPGARTEADLWMGFITKYENKYQTGGLQHLLADQIRQEVGNETFHSYFKFSFVRNPWDKAVSQYAYMAKRDDLRELIGMKEGDPFVRYLDLIRRRSHVQWYPQYRFVLDENGTQIVDFIGCFERLRADAQSVFQAIGLVAGDIPHENRSERSPYRTYYDAESEEMIRDMYREDIALFRYSF